MIERYHANVDAFFEFQAIEQVSGAGHTGPCLIPSDDREMDTRPCLLMAFTFFFLNGINAALDMTREYIWPALLGMTYC